MNITIVCGGGLLSGKEHMALELGAGLRSAGHSVEFITSNWADPKFLDRLDQLGFPSTRMRLGFISATLNWECLRMTADQIWRIPALWLKFALFLRNRCPDQIIHTNWHHLIVLWPFLKPERDWFWLHEVVPDKMQYRRVFGWLGRRLRGFVPVSRAVGESLRTLGIPDIQRHVIHNGIADPVPVGAPLVRSWSGVRIGIVGQVGEWKGHGDLLEAFAQIVGRHPGAELHIFGSATTGFASALKERAAELDVASRVVWHGFVAERAAIYGQLDICAVPSRTPDPLPTVAIEAAFFGLPVVASRCGGLPEIIQDSLTGYLIGVRNTGELAARLAELAENPELRKQMGAAARNRAQTHFNRERFVRDFMDKLSAPLITRSS